MSRARILGVSIGAALVIVSVGGCGKFYWGKPGATQEDFVRDNRDCTREAAPTPSAAQHGIVYDEMYRACLLGRGWKRQQHVTPPQGWYRGLE
jgi:hypothetical protein